MIYHQKLSSANHFPLPLFRLAAQINILLPGRFQLSCLLESRLQHKSAAVNNLFLSGLCSSLINPRLDSRHCALPMASSSSSASCQLSSILRLSLAAHCWIILKFECSSKTPSHYILISLNVQIHLKTNYFKRDSEPYSPFDGIIAGLYQTKCKICQH